MEVFRTGFEIIQLKLHKTIQQSGNQFWLPLFLWKHTTDLDIIVSCGFDINTPMIKKLYLAGILIFVLTLSLHAQTSKRVLFLGNSYTDVNNLPALTASLAQSTNDTLIYDSNTPGGYTLQGHSTNATSLLKIQQGSWDYVVLQEQSQKPSWPLSQVITDVFPYAASLCTSIRQANPCTRPMFFMTWGRKNGDSYNCPNWPPVCTYEGMDSLLNLRYRMMGDSNEAYVSPVGAVWHYIRTNFKSIELYASDESHPSLEGSYAAACTFYTLIFQKDPTLITNNYNLDPMVAANIRDAAKIIAYDSLSKWNVGNFVPKADYSANQIIDTVYFINNSTYAHSYSWDFGDGSSSTKENPKYAYNAAGTYTVQLIASQCGQSDTIVKSIQYVASGIAQHDLFVYRIYPNPVVEYMQILSETKTGEIRNIALYSIDGRLIKQFPDKASRLSLSEIQSGIYLLQFEYEGMRYSAKIIKR